MRVRALAVVALLVTGCDEPRTGEAPQGATVQLSSPGSASPSAVLDVQETPTGLTLAVTQGDIGKDGLTMRIASECPQQPGAATEAQPSADRPPSVAPELGAPPAGEDAGSTQAATKGERAASSPVTADESGQAADPMRPTTATPEQRQVELTPTEHGFEAPRLRVEEILGRAIVVEGPSGALCGRARPPVTAAPAPAG